MFTRWGDLVYRFRFAVIGVVGAAMLALGAYGTGLGDRLTQTDVHATAAFAMGSRARRWLTSLDGYEGFAVLPDGGTWQTGGFPGSSP